MRWRRIQCSLLHYPKSEGICINGTLYYLARGWDQPSYIACFDVRSENFKFIPAGFCDLYTTRLINYKGKLSVISWGSLLMHELRIWVLEDVMKHDWSEYAYTLPDDKFEDTGRGASYVMGVTATGEIVFSKTFRSAQPFYVFYFCPEKNTVQRVEIQCSENSAEFYAFVNHVDDLRLKIEPHRVQQDLLTFDMNYHQLQQDVHKFEKINKFAALNLLEDE